MLNNPALQVQSPSPAIERTDANSKKAHEQLLAKAKQGRIDVYFTGDSITRRWGATDYPAFLKHWKQHFHGWNAANFGWGGDTVQNVLWRLQNGELQGIHPKIIVVMAGTNNLGNITSQSDQVVKTDEVTLGVQAILATCREKAPQARIILMAITPRDDNRSTAPIIEQINQRLAKMADGQSIHFLTINDQLSDKSGRLKPGMSPDGLHLSLDAYEVWAKALKPIFTEILGPPAAIDQAPPPTGDPSAVPRQTGRK